MKITSDNEIEIQYLIFTLFVNYSIFIYHMQKSRTPLISSENMFMIDEIV